MITGHLLRAAAVGVAATSTLSLLFAMTGGGGDIDVTNLAWPVPNILVGTILTLRRPRLVTGWLFAAIGFLVTTGSAAEHVASTGLTLGGGVPWWVVASAWYGEWYWIWLIYITLIFVPLLFPEGRPPSARWRPVLIAAVGTLAMLTVLAALQEVLDAVNGAQVPNPIGIQGLPDVEDDGLILLLLLPSLALLLLALASLVARFRSSRGVERQQLKLFTFAAMILIVGFVAQGLVDALRLPRIAVLDILLFALTPVAAGVAILRYRLYAIDRLISRTVTYALVTALLAGIYLGAVTILTTLTAPVTRNSPIAVAAATLTAAAMFQPARKRIQAVVNRRFNRAHYDASRTVDDYRARLRDEVDLDRLCRDLVGVTGEALQPRATALWLRAPEASP